MKPVYVPMSTESLNDAEAMAQGISCLMWVVGLVRRPASDEEMMAGLQTYPHGDHTHVISIGWRLDRENVERQEERERAMAACPHVECTCGYHE